MDDGHRRDARFNLGLGLLGAGFVALITVGVTVEKLWPNPWFIVSLVATIVGIVLLLTTWRSKPKPSQPVIILPSRREGFPNWEAGHEVRNGGVLLWMRSTNASELGLAICRVQEPDGHSHRSLMRIPLPGESSSRSRWEFFYPTEFFEAPTEVWSGRYTVKWTAGGNDTLVVRDEFDVPT
jgi:hypothetical protein